MLVIILKQILIHVQRKSCAYRLVRLVDKTEQYVFALAVGYDHGYSLACHMAGYMAFGEHAAPAQR